MRKTTLQNWEIFPLTKKTRWLIPICFAFLLLGWQGNAQISYSYGWEPAGLGNWTTTPAGGGVSGVFSRSTTTACTGDASVRANAYYGLTSYLISPNFVDSNDGGEVTLSFNYKVTLFSNNSIGAATSLFTIEVQYGATASGPWTTALTIDSSNHEVSASCANQVAVFTPTPGDLYIRFATKTIGSDTDVYSYYDDIEISQGPPPSCPPPSGLTVNSVTSDSADLEWISDGNLFDLEWGEAGFTPGNGTLVTGITTNSYQLSGLDSSTTYRFFVRQDCGGGDISNWSSPKALTTLCAEFDSPFEQPFSNGSLPNCWTNTSSNPVATGLWKFTGAVDYAAGHGRTNGTFAWVDGSDPSTISDVTLTTPPINLSSLIDPELRFEYFSNSGNTSYPNNIFKVEISDGSDWTEVYSNNTNSSLWREISIPLTAYAGTTIQVRFIVDKTPPAIGFAFYNDILLDNVIVDNAPTCKVPTDLSVDGVTSNSVSLHWEPSDSNPALGYEYAFSTTNELPEDLDSSNSGTVDAGEVSAHVSVLESSTTYFFWLRAVCSTTDTSTWVAFNSFKTPCEEFADFTEEFETTATGTVMPECWSRKIVSPQSGPYIYVYAGDANSGTRALRMGNSGDANAQLYAITPPLADLSQGTHRLKFYAKGSTYVTLEVGTMTDANDQSTFTSIETFPLTTSHQYFSLNFDTPTTDSFIAFKATYAGTYYFASIDDVVWEPIPPCGDVSNLSYANISAYGATLNWNPADSETAWQYALGLSTDTDPEAVATVDVPGGNPTADLSDLEPNTLYKFWIRSDCGGGIYGAWMGPVSFLTACEAELAPTEVQTFETEVPACWKEATGALTDSSNLTGTASAWVSAASFGHAVGGSNKAIKINLYGTKNDWYISHPIDLGDTPDLYRVSYKMAVTAYNAPGSQSTLGTHMVRVVVSPDGGNTWSNADVIRTYTGAGTYSNTGQNEAIDLQGYTGIIKIAFVATTTSTSPDIDFHIDDFKVEPLPDCADVFNLSHENVMAHQATINWETNGSETNWQYAIGSSTDTDPDSLVAVDVTGGIPTVTIADLDSSTPYKVWVRSDCGAGLYGAWIGPVSFSTTCDTFEAPFLEEFSNGAIPMCWTNTSSNTVANGLWKFTGAVDYAAGHGKPNGTFAWVDGSDPSTISDVTLITPPVDLSTLTDPELRFEYFSNSGNTDYPNNIFTVEVNNGSEWTEVYTDNTNSNQWRIVSVPLTDYAGGIIQVRFIVDKTPPTTGYAFYNDILLDNVSFDNAPTCNIPQNLVVSDVLATSATLNWEPSSSNPAIGYEYVFATSTTLPDVIDAGNSGTVGPGITTATLENLTSASNYSVWLRSLCDASDSSAWITRSFLTSVENDECSNATPLTVGATFADYAVQGSNFGATKDNADPIPTCDAYNFATNGKDVWFSFEVPESGSVTIETGSVTGSSLTDTGLEILSGTCGALTVVSCNADISAAVPYNRFSRVILTDETPGEILLARVYGYDGTSGAFMISAFDSTLSNPSFEHNTLKVYPNPVKDILKLSYTQNISNVSIFNMLGQEVMVKAVNANQGQIDMSNLATGTYLVKVVADNMTKTIKVLKQ